MNISLMNISLMIQELLYDDLIRVVFEYISHGSRVIIWWPHPCSHMNISLMVQELFYGDLIREVLWIYLSLFKIYYMVTSSA